MARSQRGSRGSRHILTGPARWAVRPVSYDFKKIATQSPGSALGPWKRLPDGAAMSVPGEPIVRHLIHAQSEG